MSPLPARVALAALLLLTAPARGGAAAPKAGERPEVVRFEDGLELVVFPQPGARRSTLWIVVRAGAVNDPRGKSGLAHLVEHLALGGSHDVEARAFFDEARAAGAIVNAHTYPERITFELDAPAEKLESLGARFLGLVTSPAFQDAKIARERGIIETEAAYHSTEGLLSLVDLAVFPSPQQGGTLAGTEESRSSLGVEDAIAFFQSSMVPENLTVLLAGAVTPAQGRGLVERAFRIPPARAGEGSSRPVERASLPVQQKVQAGVVVAMLGYLLDPADLGACPAVAQLLDLRLTLAVQVATRRVSSVSVGCSRLRGNDFLIAFAYTSTLDSPELPQDMKAVFEGLATAPPTAQERALVDGQLARRVQRTLADPGLLAERLAVLASERTGGRTDLGRLRPRPLPPASQLGALVRRSLTRDREVLLDFSPMQN